MEKNKSQIILLDKNGLETVAKALSSACWTLTESGNLEIGSIAASSSAQGSAPQLTLAQGNARPVTQVSVTGGSANSGSPGPPERPPAFQRDNSQVTTLNELGKKLLAAAKVGNTSQVRTLMAIGAPFASDGPIGMTPLHLASQNGHYETCDRLLAAGMNKDARNKVDKTPLHLAAMEGHMDIVSLLVKSGANINACDMLKMTALHWACDRGHTSIVGLLLKHHAKTDVANKFSKPPLHLAVERGHQQIVRLLQEGVNYKEEEEAVAVESISLNVTDDLNSIPVVCKTEEVCTEEYEEEPVEGQVKKEAEERFSMEGDLPHSILADDSDDQNTSVLATLAELAEATSKGSEGTEDVASAAALELLKAQAALLPVDDSSTLVTSAVAHGQTLHLTEAGRQALKLIKQEMPLLPTATLKQDHLNIDHNKSARSRNNTNSNSQRNGNKQSESSYSSSTLTAPCLPALLSSSSVESIVEEIAEESQEVTQVITLSPEQYAALTGETNGPIILQVLSSAEEQLNELDTGQTQPAPKRQKVMQLVTKTGQGLPAQNQAVAKVSGQVLSVDVSGGSNL
ncbi:ankyrin repeat and KH domain-containing protein 1-like isoform X1 [Penaeus japonicus]|uniref:ankyrin repeat and KH domain-containing protein 1-like isoform X1 n=2 Tax=Penaeus japonicus TaxID=27405 RepID=UPI001C70C14E|nr:ankyrin repeat and KH domain-containing protein 1-like isoform X1 [Penaeus japonicus]